MVFKKKKIILRFQMGSFQAEHAGNTASQRHEEHCIQETKRFGVHIPNA